MAKDGSGQNPRGIILDGKLLSIWRKRCNLTQEELADKIGVHVRSIQRAESGIPVDPALRIWLADALNIPPAFLDPLEAQSIRPVESSSGVPRVRVRLRLAILEFDMPPEEFIQKGLHERLFQDLHNRGILEDGVEEPGAEMGSIIITGLITQIDTVRLDLAHKLFSMLKDDSVADVAFDSGTQRVLDVPYYWFPSSLIEPDTLSPETLAIRWIPISGPRLSQLRKQKGWEADQLARQCQLDPLLIRACENDPSTRVTRSTTQEMALALDTTPDQLVRVGPDLAKLIEYFLKRITPSLALSGFTATFRFKQSEVVDPQTISGVLGRIAPIAVHFIEDFSQSVGQESKITIFGHKSLIDRCVSTFTANRYEGRLTIEVERASLPLALIRYSVRPKTILSWLLTNGNHSSMQAMLLFMLGYSNSQIESLFGISSNAYWENVNIAISDICARRGTEPPSN